MSFDKQDHQQRIIATVLKNSKVFREKYEKERQELQEYRDLCHEIDKLELVISRKEDEIREWNEELRTSNGMLKPQEEDEIEEDIGQAAWVLEDLYKELGQLYVTKSQQVFKFRFVL